MANAVVMTVLIDPLDHFEKLDREGIENELGLLPWWATSYNPLDGISLREYMQNQYCFPLNFSDVGEVTADHVYLFPGDPPYYPMLVVVFSTGQKFVQYIYGMVSFFDFDGEGGLRWFHSRMD